MHRVTDATARIDYSLRVTSCSCTLVTVPGRTISQASEAIPVVDELNMPEKTRGDPRLQIAWMRRLP
jgi:hypothetical protein